MKSSIAVVLLSFLSVFSCSTIVQSEPSAPSCGTVTQEIAPCLSFLKGKHPNEGGNKPSTECCSGVKELSLKAKTKQDRQAICLCTKTALSQVGDYDPSRIPLISKSCGLSFALPPIDKNTDCSKY
ncbi:hypothetical protein FNV43_RR18151 [Rhamnella rubrinervis]|uniref:Non-specific lipid-transfer protein n=1 Tax=Rhamnella rubrinervis TaxID=2594499 RepID=A0A8K0GW89_9ROSA|nr:hypothetical protein FNV43_RR18151 [Rhamnella rubrinervis]